MKKNVLLLGLLVAGLGLAGCATDTDKEETKTNTATSEVEEDLATPTPTPGGETEQTDPLDPSLIAYPERTENMPAFLSGELPEGAPMNLTGSAELVLLNEKYCMVDVIMNGFQDKFDARGTYTFENNVLTATVYMPKTSVGGKDSIPAARTTITTTYDEATQTYTGTSYKIVGGFTMEFPLKGKWANVERSITGAFTFGAGTQQATDFTAALELQDAGKAFLDFDCAAPSLKTAFDKTGTFTIKDGKITCTFGKGEAATTLELVAGQDGKLAGTYKLVGGEGEIPVALKGAFPGKVAAPAPEAGGEDAAE